MSAHSLDGGKEPAAADRVFLMGGSESSEGATTAASSSDIVVSSSGGGASAGGGSCSVSVFDFPHLAPCYFNVLGAIRNRGEEIPIPEVRARKGDCAVDGEEIAETSSSDAVLFAVRPLIVAGRSVSEFWKPRTDCRHSR